MSLLSMVQDAATRIGLAVPSTIITNTDLKYKELLVLANQEGQELARAVQWQEIITETTFTTLAQAAQTSAIPVDFDRFVDDSMYNRTRRRKIFGPITAQEWQARQALNLAATVNYWFRVRGSQILITPSPTAGETVAYEYLSNKWCSSSDGSTKRSSWADDTDIGIIPETLMSKGITWRWLKTKGLSTWEGAYQQYLDEKAKASASQEGSPTLTAGSRTSSLLQINVPEGNFG